MRRIFIGRQQDNETERVRRLLLLDEQVLVISTFELNKVASLTYNELVCDDLFEVIEKIVAQPMRSTPLALHKTVEILKHILIYGSEKCVNSSYGIGKFIESLQSYNTVLLAQERRGPGGLIQRIKGGGVDKGEPVRAAAKKITVLLDNIKELQRIRNENASKDSLVPVGSNRVGFITDEVRLTILKKRMAKQQRIDLKSNLTKSEGGFGGGYNARDGKAVVGAAHGIEEMVKMASKQKKKFSDDGTPDETEDEKILKELMAEARAAKEETEAAKRAAEADLLGRDDSNPTYVPDLLDFGTDVEAPAPSAGASSALLEAHDLLGAFTPTSAPIASMDPFSPMLGSSLSEQSDLLRSHALPYDPFGVAPPTHMMDLGMGVEGLHIDQISEAAGRTPQTLNGSLQSLRSGSVILGMHLNRGSEPEPKTGGMMSSNEDRFAALDALASDTQTLRATALDVEKAENRILSLTNANTASHTIPLGTSPPPEPIHSAGLNSRDFSVSLGMSSGSATVMKAGSGQVATKYGDVGDNDDIPWVMGGMIGSGLGDPIAPAPGAPPPPPPP